MLSTGHVALAVVLVAATSCVTANPHRFYHGPEKPTEEVAVVFGEYNSWDGPLTTIHIIGSGSSSPGGEWELLLPPDEYTTKAYLTPGPTLVSLCRRVPGDFWEGVVAQGQNRTIKEDLFCWVLKMDLEPGHTYRAVTMLAEGDVSIQVLDEATGGNIEVEEIKDLEKFIQESSAKAGAQ
jgi:hypothetical protein